MPDCSRPHYGRGWCEMHYRRWQKHGDPTITKRAQYGEPMTYLIEHMSDEAAHDGWPFGHDSNGYGVVFDPTVGHSQTIHHIVCRLAHGPRPHRAEAAHACRVRDCFWAEHLSWKTVAENQADRLRDGTHSRGERNHFAKLTNAQAEEIRQRWPGVSQQKLADEYGVHVSTIGRITRRVTFELIL